MTLPTYQDSKPTNLQAAILDAMFWLRLLRSRLYDEPQLPLTEQREHQAYLRLAVQALQGFLPEEACPEQDQSDVEVKRVLTPVQQAKVSLIREKLRARQRAMRELEG